MAFRLNQILAHLYPNAIPHQYKRRQKSRKTPEVPLSSRTVPFNVLFPISDGTYHASGNQIYGPNTFTLGASFLSRDSETKKAVHELLSSIGGVPEKAGFYYTFDYNAGPIIEEILAFGEVPDRFSHQYYPTPEQLADIASDLAEIDEDDVCLEPSAGQGHMASFLPKERTICVEVSALHCTILKEKGYRVLRSDFLETTRSSLGMPSGFNVIVMNPPFSAGRAEAHVRHALTLLAPGGRLVAIVPAGSSERWNLNADSKDSVEVAGVYENAFENTGVRVQMLVYRKASEEVQEKAA
jgi:predicted RNA methylase